jgi:4-phytase/acid phosphatase
LLVGHDTNIAALSGALGVNWIMDGRISDPAPGGALRFEIWRARADGKLSVRLVYAAQTLDQMRRAEPLTPANPPAEAVLFVPACSRADQSCSWEDFSTAARQAIDPAYLTAQP